MSVHQEIRSISPDLSTMDLLRYLIVERFPGKTLVTASLKAPSIVVLKMVADIDPTTPVAFCSPGYRFPESNEYRERILAVLHLVHFETHTRGTARKNTPEISIIFRD